MSAGVAQQGTAAGLIIPFGDPTPSRVRIPPPAHSPQAGVVKHGMAAELLIRWATQRLGGSNPPSGTQAHREGSRREIRPGGGGGTGTSTPKRRRRPNASRAQGPPPTALPDDGT